MFEPARDPAIPPAPAKNTPVKITDVAAAAGVAPMTVSRVINTPDRVSPETTARVREAIDRLGYVPNLIAGGLSSRKSRMVAAIVPTIAHPMFASVVQSFSDSMRHAGYQVMLSISGYDEHRRRSHVPRPAGTAPRRLADHRIGLQPRRVADADRSPHPRGRDLGRVEPPDRHDDRLRSRPGRRRGRGVPAGQGSRPVRRADGARFPSVGAHPRLYRGGDARPAASVVLDQQMPAPSTIAAGRDGLRALLPLLDQRCAVFCSSDLMAFGVDHRGPGAGRSGSGTPRGLRLRQPRAQRDERAADHHRQPGRGAAPAGRPPLSCSGVWPARGHATPTGSRCRSGSLSARPPDRVSRRYVTDNIPIGLDACQRRGVRE